MKTKTLDFITTIGGTTLQAGDSCFVCPHRNMSVGYLTEIKEIVQANPFSHVKVKNAKSTTNFIWVASRFIMSLAEAKAELEMQKKLLEEKLTEVETLLTN